MSVRDTLAHLLPKSFPWNLTYTRPFTRLIDGIVPSLDDARDNADEVWSDLIPATTGSPAFEAWERQFALQASSALTTQERRDRLAASWSALGGQSPGYLTDTLQAQGFDVYTHEWWDISAHGYPAAKDPRDHLLPVHGGTDTDGILISNLIRSSQAVNPIGAGESYAQAGEPQALAGYFDGFNIVTGTAVYQGPSSTHGYYLYIGAQTFPNTVNIPVARKDEFETLCQKICPAQQWLVLRVRYV
jgi:hypothetical protein